MFLIWLKNLWNKLFGKKESLTTIVRRGFEIILPIEIYNALAIEKVFISVVLYKGKPSCIQLCKNIEGKAVYVGTLKDYMKVKSFKDGNNCNFAYSNIERM